MHPMPVLRTILAALCLTLALAAGRAGAADVACLTFIAGEKRALVYDPDEPNIRANITLRERTFGGPEGIECPGYVTLGAILRGLNPDISYSEMQPFCLRYDPGLATYTGVGVGKRTARLLCRTEGKGLCHYVNGSKDTALAVAGMGTKLMTGMNTAATAAGVSATADASGAVILSGPASYLSGAFASLGASALSAVTAPATLTAAAVTVVVVGGAVYACSD
jgi:hypothetical protein